MSELVVGSIAGLAANSYEVGIASGSTLDLANAKAGSIPDTALSAVPGLKHIHTETFTSVASINLDNIFSADYDNYCFVIDFVGSTALNLELLYRTGGVTNTSTIYRSNRLYTVGSTVVSQGDTTGSIAYHGYSAFGEFQSKVSSGVINIFNPYKATNTTFTALNHFDYASIGPHTMHNSGSTTVTDSFDGVTIRTNTGIIAGTLRIYGWSN